MRNRHRDPPQGMIAAAASERRPGLPGPAGCDLPKRTVSLFADSDCNESLAAPSLRRFCDDFFGNSKGERHMRSILVLCLVLAGTAAQAATFDIKVDGTDAIYLAGRTDLVVPDPALSWPGGLARHGGPTPEEAKETLPPSIGVVAGDVVKVLDPASGCINFFNGPGSCFGPEGNGNLSSSNLTAFGGISGYRGTQGALVGVFLDDDVPDGAPPAAIDFPSIGVDFAQLSPGLGQVFFIGNGKNAADAFQSFIAPVGATRLFFGIPDGFGFVGTPGAYDDNDGSYRIRVGVNETPAAVPLPAAGLLLAGGIAALGLLRRRRSAAA
jgi:hypothetical protein